MDFSNRQTRQIHVKSMRVYCRQLTWHDATLSQRLLKKRRNTHGGYRLIRVNRISRKSIRWRNARWIRSRIIQTMSESIASAFILWWEWGWCKRRQMRGRNEMDKLRRCKPLIPVGRFLRSWNAVADYGRIGGCECRISRRKVLTWFNNFNWRSTWT